MTTEPLDLRLAPAALAGWAATAVGVGWPVGRALIGAAVLLALGVAVAWAAAYGQPVAVSRRNPVHDRRRLTAGSRRGLIAGCLVGAAGLAVGGLHAGAVAAGPVPDLADRGASVEVTGSVFSDPVPRDGDYGPFVVTRVRLTEVTGRGSTTGVRSPVLVIGDPGWQQVKYGDTIHAAGQLRPSQGPDLAAVLIARGPPETVAEAGSVYRAVGGVRAGLTEAASVLPPAERSLVPALVDGDDTTMPEDVVTQFQTTGLTHLLAVSGANLTLMLSFWLLVARWCGVRGRGLVVAGAVGVVFFVLLARPQPSVLRAAAMGVVALAGLSSGGRRRGIRALCVAVVGLVLVDPWLARSVGFLLSTVATAGILLLVPRWRDCLAGWMPRPLAEAIAVPLAAQLACTPVIAAISEQVSLVAVLTNLLVAAAVGPTTVLGLVAGLLALVSDGLGHLVAYLAGVPAWWIVWVAEHGAGLDGSSVAWPAGLVGIAALTAVCLTLTAVMPRLLSRRWWSVAAAAVLVAAVVQPVGRLGWPPDDWVMVMCDVGQGDALVLNAGHSVAVVVDAGPEPALVDACLDRLQVETVALVVLTHFHADHVDGLPGVARGREVSEVEVSPLADPPGGAEFVTGWAAAAGVPVTVAAPGETRTVGELSWQVIGPTDVSTTDSSGGEEGSAPNNASVVMLVQSHGVRLLLSGDAEPEEEQDILAAGAEIQVDVLKAAHHGSANQDDDFVFETQARVALISVGADNDYGHPAPETLSRLHQLGAEVYRTDQDGDIAVVQRSGQLSVVTSRR